MWEEIFHIGKDIVGGIAKGDSGTQIFLGILVAVGGMLAKPAFEWLAERNRPLAITLSMILLVFAIYMLISTWDYNNEDHSKANTPEEEPTTRVDSSRSIKPEITTDTTPVMSTDTTPDTPN